MAYDYPKLFHAIAQAVKSSRTATDCLIAVISECERQMPHPHWIRMRALDFEADTSRLRGWLPQVLAVEPASRPDGLLFGLLNLEGECGTTTADLCVVRASTRDADYPHWEFEELRDEALLQSEVLSQIYAVAYGSDEGLGNAAEHPLTLAYAAAAARFALEDGDGAAALSALRETVVGFLDGDCLYLGGFVDGVFILNVRVG